MKLHNADTGDTITVPDNAALAVYERSGWKPAPEPKAEPDVPEGPLLPDVPPDEPKRSPKPRS